ncbi:MAG TPA: glycosyltransferase family 39 protein [Gemmatimonadaceae bacterium]|nr:glycosyltransferase family 39 protein [Gemmatimonadaceae bacterium]
MTTADGSTSTRDGADGNLWRQALWILLASTLLRLVLAVLVPLFPDEAYYWEWSRRLAGGYFDHPPAIALLIAGGTALLGDTALGVRVLPILAGTFAGFWLVRTACHLAGPRAARYTALIFAVLPLAAGGLVLATPDAPLLAGIAWTLYAVVRALDVENAEWSVTAYWLVAGVAIGAAMASKFTGVLVPVAIVIAMLAHAPLRARLAHAGPWLAVAVASLVMVPVLWWNAQHDWVAFVFQLGHGLGTTARGNWFGRELELIGGQAGLVTPILFVLLLGATWRALFPPRDDGRDSPDPMPPSRLGGRDARDPVRFTLAVVTAFCLLFFMYSATRKSVEANWPAIAWMPAIMLLGAARRGLRTAWERRALWLAGALTAAALVHVVVPIFPLPARRDQVSKAHGWDRLAAAVEDSRTRWDASPTPAAGPRRTAGAPSFLATNRYQDAAMLAFHLDDHPTLYSLNLGARHNQYDLWPGFTDRAQVGASMLLVLEEPAEGLPGPIQRLTGHFASIEPGELVRLTRASPTRGEEYVGRRRLWRLEGWSGTWPADP